MANVGTLARHVRAGDDLYVARYATHSNVIGNELACGLDPIKHRMTTLPKIQYRLVGQLGTTVASRCRQHTQAAQDIQASQYRSTGLEPQALGRNPVPDHTKELLLQRHRLLLGSQHLLLVLLQLRSHVTFLVLQRLFADVLLGHLAQLCRGHLQVVAKHLVEAHLQIRDPRPLAFARLVRRNPLLATASQATQSIQLFVKTVPDHPPLGHQQGRLVDQRQRNLLENVFTQVQLLVQFAQQPRTTLTQQSLQGRQASQRPGQATHVTRRRTPGGDS